MLFVLFKRRPVLRVLAKVNLVDCPEASHLVLVHLPDVVVLDRKNNEAVRVLLEKGLWLDFLSQGAIHDADLGRSGDVLRGNNLRACPAISRVVLVEHLRAGALGSATLGLRELLRHSQILFLFSAEKF